MDDYFPVERRTTANSIFMFGYGLGTALSFLTPISIGYIGWRLTFVAIGGFGLFFGLLVLVTVSEPGRFRFYLDDSIEFVGDDPVIQKRSMIKELLDGIKVIMASPTARLVLAGSCLRLSDGYIVGYFA